MKDLTEGTGAEQKTAVEGHQPKPDKVRRPVDFGMMMRTETGQPVPQTYTERTEQDP